MVNPALLPDIFLLPEKIADPICFCQKRLVFRIALLYISGKHPEITIDHQRPAKYVKNKPCDIVYKDRGHDHSDQPQDKQELRKLVNAVSSLHKTYQFFLHI